MFIFILVCSTEIISQENTNDNFELGKGIPKITYYGTNDYNAYSQNWAVVQDSAGIMYFGNGWGILTYDGTSWSLLNLPNNTTVFALAIDKKNKIYVGAEGEIGYLDANQHGELSYVSLLTFLKKKIGIFPSVE